MQEPRGLSSSEALTRFKKFGPNEIEEKKKSFWAKVVKQLLSPIFLMFVGAMALTYTAGRMFEFRLIFVLAFVNIFITLWQERKADNAIAALRKQFQVQTKVLRDGAWEFVESKYLVPGDMVEIGVGDLIPADMRITKVTNASVNEASLTGESLPKEKVVGDTAFSGSFLSTGLIQAEVVATGRNTEFGKTLFLIDNSLRTSSLEKDIVTISRMIAIMSIVVIVIFSAVFIFRHAPIKELLLVDLSLLIAGIPIGLPTVMTVIIALGVAELSKKGAIVRRLASLEDLANVDLLLSDKTGTLTENKLKIQDIVPYGKYDKDDVVRFSAYAVNHDKSEINKMIIDAADRLQSENPPNIKEFIPADSERKRSSASFSVDGEDMIVSFGAVQVVMGLCSLDKAARREFEKDVEEFAADGYRTLAVAINKKGTNEEDMELVGIIAFADGVREESKGVIDFLKENGVAVKMVTGDNYLISKKVSGDLGLLGDMASGNELKELDWEHTDKGWLESKSGFAEVLPIDKYHLVELGKKSHTVASTGDGVNDLPALKIANVGIAVSNAVDALKGTADIMLLLPGIQVIKDALVEARKIFARLYVYSVYRISESFRLIITIGVLGVVFGDYILTAIQVIILALMNDIPIISLAFNKVRVPHKPAFIHQKKRLVLASLYGLSGVANGVVLFFILKYWTDLSNDAIQTAFFLMLAVSGHMLIYVAHTKERWYKFLPSPSVLWATLGTQVVSSLIAGFGIFMTAISFDLVVFIWIWSFIWMQLSEFFKVLTEKIEDHLA